MNKNLKPKEEEKFVPHYNPQGDERKVWDDFQDRKKELLDSKKNVNGIDIDAKMRQWDTNYFNKVADIPASELDESQQPVAINNAFAKIQTALSIMVDRAPDFKLDERLELYSANNEIIRALLRKSWQRTDSLYQFLLFVFNMAKRGYGVGRTYHQFLEHPARFRKAKEGKEVYETHNIRKSDDIVFKNLDNLNVWIDEEARPFDFFSIRDWMWREVWHIDKIKSVFKEDEYPNIKYVQEGGNVAEEVEGQGVAQQQRELKKGMTEVYFYENQFDDKFIVEINGIMVCWEPLPQDHKRLSLVTAPWNLRSAETIYGIGIIEELEKNDKIADRILNMTMRQLLLCIAPMGFFQGTDDPDMENMKIKPGVIKKVLGNPKDIQFLKIPAPDGKGMEMIDWLEQKEEQDTGITKILAGDIEQLQRGETAFAQGVSREAGLKRLKLPLHSLKYSFSWEARNRADLIKQIYSQFDVEKIVNPELIKNYLAEVANNPDYFFIKDKELFMRKFPEEQLQVDQNEKGAYIESEDKKFFKIKPEMLFWEGDIWIDVDSMLVHSEELEKLDTIRMVNTLSQLVSLPPELFTLWSKQILEAFNKDAKKWLPDNTAQLMQQNQMQQGEASNVPTTELERTKNVGTEMSGSYKQFQDTTKL